VTLHWLDLALVVAIVVAGCGASCFLLLGKLRRIMAEDRREMERRLAALTEATMMRTAAPQEAYSATYALAANEIETEQATAGGKPAGPTLLAGSRLEEASQEEEEIPAPIQVAIAAAAIAAFGNHARVRSARRIPSSSVVSPWTQQGRVIVQSSHNLRTQGSR
jgi:hypothetical protein